MAVVRRREAARVSGNDAIVTRLRGHAMDAYVPPAVSGTPEESLTGDGNGVKTGAKIVRHGRSITFQMAEVMISRGVFQQVLDAIGALRPLPSARF
jgi:hypothetical protein